MIAVIGGDSVHDLSYLHVLAPVPTGAMVMLLVAMVVNNLATTRRYPRYWF